VFYASAQYTFRHSEVFLGSGWKRFLSHAACAIFDTAAQNLEQTNVQTSPGLHLQVKHNRAVLSYLLAASGKPSDATGGQNARAISLPHVLADLLLSDVASIATASTQPSSNASSYVPPTLPAQSIPAQVNLATLLLAHGFALASLQLSAPVMHAVHGLPDGIGNRAFCNVVEAQLMLRALKVCWTLCTTMFECSRTFNSSV
jgi:hypothetical protein